MSAWKGADARTHVVCVCVCVRMRARSWRGAAPMRRLPCEAVFRAKPTPVLNFSTSLGLASLQAGCIVLSKRGHEMKRTQAKEAPEVEVWQLRDFVAV